MNLTIPARTSSKSALESQKLHFKQSRAELKRKLSEVSFDEHPLQHRKLRIEDRQIQLEEQKLHKIWLDNEYQQQHLYDECHRKAHRDTNSSIVSLGSDLWTEHQEIRRQEEKEGKVLRLGSDTKGAFICTLLALYKDPKMSRKRLSARQSNMKESAIKVYDAEQGAPEKGDLWCCVSQKYYNRGNVHAAHIAPHALGPELVDYIFGSGSGSRLDSSDNCLLLHRDVEAAFDNGNFVLLPVDAGEVPILRWKIQMTNTAAVGSDMGNTKLKAIDGKELSFKNDHRPASRFLYYHFIVTLLRNKRDRQPGCDKYAAELPIGRPFAIIGRHMRDSMLLVLAKNAGDLNREARRLGGGGETFVEGAKLTDSEESEIVRRVFEVHERESEDAESDEED